MLLRTVELALLSSCISAFAPPPRTHARNEATSLHQQPPSSSPVPSPSAPRSSTAEEAVQNQLRHYQASRLPDAFRCCSPDNREATGALADFERLVRTPPYDLLLGHARADVLLETAVPDEFLAVSDDGGGRTTAAAAAHARCLLVRIRPGATARRRHPVWFWWEVSRGAMPGDPDGGAGWRVDCVMPDFDDLEFEAEALSLEEFGEEFDEDDDGDDELSIFWDFEV